MMPRVSYHFRPLASAVAAYLARQGRGELSDETSSFVDAVTRHALLRPDLFGDKLAEAIAGIYVYGPGFIQDPTRKGVLYLDVDGHIISLVNVELAWDASASGYIDIRGFDRYDVLTGPLAGHSYTQADRPIPDAPEYKPRLIARWLRRPPAPSAVTVSLELDADLLAWFRGKGPTWEHLINAALDRYIRERRTPLPAQLPAPSTTRVELHIAPDIHAWLEAQGETWEQHVHWALRTFVRAHDGAGM